MDVIAQLNSHVSNMRGLEEAYEQRESVLGEHITLLRELCQSNSESQDRVSALVVNLETLTASLHNQLEGLTATNNHLVHDAIHYFRRETEEEITALIYTCSQLLVAHETMQEEQAECHDSSPPISPPVAEFSTQATRAGKVQLGRMRKKWELTGQPACWRLAPIDTMPIPEAGSSQGK
ncbi:uncharacterized protein BDV17DRAFT_258259 [Aspergillus undulatus]|uniref:uncharacterized protein n=1 Tax=Aspergillus undulatus TaxID=1810928 RepID=UPI003CCCB55D